MPNNNQRERNGIHPVNMQPKDLNSDRYAPEIARQQRDIEEGSRREAEQQWGERVEDEEHERVADDVADDLAVPGSAAEGCAVEDPGLRPVDQHTPEGELPDYFVHGPLGDEELFEAVAEAVEAGSEEGEEVALQLVRGRVIVLAGDVVGGEEDAHTADAEEDAGVLREMVTHVEEDERDDDNNDNGPEVNQLGREDGGLSYRLIFLYIKGSND